MCHKQHLTQGPLELDLLKILIDSYRGMLTLPPQVASFKLNFITMLVTLNSKPCDSPHLPPPFCEKCARDFRRIPMKCWTDCGSVSTLMTQSLRRLSGYDSFIPMCNSQGRHYTWLWWWQSFGDLTFAGSVEEITPFVTSQMIRMNLTVKVISPCCAAFVCFVLTNWNAIIINMILLIYLAEG